MLDYLRNGGTLPSLPQGDKELFERIRAEFDYFCFLPNPVNETRTLLERFKSDGFSMTTIGVRAPEEAFEPRGHVIEANIVAVTDGGDYVVMLSQQVRAIQLLNALTDHMTERVHWTPALWAFSLDDTSGSPSAKRAYKLAAFEENCHGIEAALPLNGYEACFCDSPTELRIVDVRRDYTNNSIQTLVCGGDYVLEDIYLGLSSTHVAAHSLDNVLVWDRATAQRIRVFSTCHWDMKLRGSRLFIGEWMYDGADYTLERTVYDFSSDKCAPIFMRTEEELALAPCLVDDSFAYFFTSGAGAGTLIAVHDVRTGQKIREMRVSTPSPFRLSSTSVQLSEEGRPVVFGSCGDMMYVLDLLLGEIVGSAELAKLPEGFPLDHLCLKARRAVRARFPGGPNWEVGEVVVYNF